MADNMATEDTMQKGAITIQHLEHRLPNVCRICLSIDVATNSVTELYRIEDIFLDEGDALQSEIQSFREIISVFINEEIGHDAAALIPTSICLGCVEKARSAFNFIEMCRRHDSLLEEYLLAYKAKTEEHIRDMPLIELYEEITHEHDQVIEEVEYAVETIDETGTTDASDMSVGILNHRDTKAKSTDHSIGNGRLECEMCNKTFTQSQTLRRHWKIHNRHTATTKTCAYCHKSFLRGDDLKRHERIHTGERPYKCTMCPKSYKQSSELKEHAQTHSHKDQYTCTICSKSIRTRNGYYIHMKIHSGVKNHTCSYCSKKFITSGELNSHTRRIHTKAAKPVASDLESVT